MTRPKTKAELLTASSDRFARLNSALNALTPALSNATFPFEHRDRNVRDVLAHVHAWHLMMLDWYETGMAGSKPDMPAKGYTWKSTPELNAAIREKYQNTSLLQIRKKLDSSHEAARQLITKHTDDELFTKCQYPWTGSTSLGSYLISATSSHYDWALKLLRRLTRRGRDNVR